ncbi:MAG TPA: hypothetical protein VFX49_00545 [Chloroflexota bacterium]|nr:hypothetical protein [Chloroflexota bacterium]
MEWLIALTGIGCGTAIVLTFIDKVFGGNRKQLQQEVKMAQERARLTEAQLIESHRQNDQLQKQLEWHTKMLETQDRLMKQLTDGSAAASGASGSREPVGTSR